MSDSLNIIRALTTSAGPWLHRKFAWIALALGIVAAGALLQLDVIPSFPQSKSGLTTQWYKLGTLAALPILSFAAWLISTQVYLRSGSGAKIGLAYEGPNVNISDWKKTKAILKDFLSNGQIKSRISLRFVPLRATEIEFVGQQYMKRYGFSILLSVQAAAPNDKSKPFERVCLKISHGQDASKYFKTTLENTLAIYAVKNIGKSFRLSDYHRKQAETLSDMLLLFVATHFFIHESYEDASVILRYIDKSLQSKLPKTNPPRFRIRELDMHCCIKRLEFPIDKVPPRDELERRISFGERAMCYFDEFAGVYIALSRAKFLYGDLDGTLELTSQVKKVIDNLKNKGIPVSKPAEEMILLNSGFLYFIQGHWNNACDSYKSMLALDGAYSRDCTSLVAFIDHVQSLECYEGIPYLQVLYRRIAKKSIPLILNDSAIRWLGEDGSRARLKDLMNEVRPTDAKRNGKPRKTKKKRARKRKKRR